MKVLVLKLEGPMASFGSAAVDEKRPTGRHPAKSMIAGLLASALGIDRLQTNKTQELQDQIKIASRVDRPGHVMTDYQIALAIENNPKVQCFINSNVWSSRPVNERTLNNKKAPIQVYRDYVVDTCVTVGITTEDAGLVGRLADAVKKPAHPLFLGRKACPPSRPIFEAVVDAETLFEALKRYPLSPCDDTTERKLVSYSGDIEPGAVYPDSSHRIFQVRDLRDWTNNFHSNDRTVVECLLEISS